MRFREWRRAPDRRDEARAVAGEQGVHAVVAHILLNRGIAPEQMRDFLQPGPALVHDPALLPDMDAAAERFATAVRERQKVVIYGDYDCDGATAGALVSRFLRRRGVPYLYYVPNRFEEGYGVNAKAVMEIHLKEKPGLLLTVDCGITAAEELDTLKHLGTDVIVTDHHQVPERLPAVPAVDPHRADSLYPYKQICGAAVAYKLCCAAASLLGEDVQAVEDDLIELVCIGTVADVMPLLDENRYWAWHGLKRLRHTDAVGLQALMEVAGLGDRPLTARDIGYGIGPRLNAAGRLDTAQLSYQLLITEDRAEAYELAGQLEAMNRERREIEARLLEEASEQVGAMDLNEVWGVTVFGPGWHEGVLGLVAGRLCRQHFRPVLAIATNGEDAKGSGRSTEALNLHAALAECESLLTGFGGHERAAGFKLKAAQVPELRQRFNEVVRSHLTADDLSPTIDCACVVKGSHLTLELAKELEALEPFGEGNPAPHLEVSGLRLGDWRTTRDGVHLQLTLVIERRVNGRAVPGGELKGFWPRGAQYADRLQRGRPIRAVGSLCVDRWKREEQAQPREKPQFVVEDMRYD